MSYGAIGGNEIRMGARPGAPTTIVILAALQRRAEGRNEFR